MKIPYFKQETEYTCGAACVRMILASMGVKKTEKQIVNLLKTNKRKGTWHKMIPKLAEKYKFDYVVERNGKMSDLRNYYKKGWKIIICYLSDKIPHYSVLRKINWHSIYLFDPAFSPNHWYFINNFKRIWKDDEEKRWFIAIKKA